MERGIEASRHFWQAVHARDIVYLSEHIHEDAMFIHMGVSFDREGELNVIKSGNIVYKTIDFQEVTVKDLPGIVMVYEKLQLTAIVGGNEVTNPFVVTEVFIQIGDRLQLASLAFTKIIY